MSVRRLFLLLFAVALFAMGVRETLDPDMWWHLRTGEYILQQGIPRQDVFSFTVPGREWITHEWLSQVFMWLVYQAGGLTGLILVFAAIIALTYWLLYLACAGRPFLSAFVVLLSALTSAIVWGARPQIFNLLLTALFLLIIERVREGHWSARWLWSLPLLTVVWANLHSGYLLGVVLIGTYSVGEAAQRLLQPQDARSLPWPLVGRLFAVTLFSFLAAALNPNGPELWIYPFITLASPSMQAFIQEWHPPDFNLRIFWPFAALLIVGLLGWIYSRKRPTGSELLLFGGTAWAGLTSARNVPLFAIIATPIIARHLLCALRETPLQPWVSGTQPETPLPARLRILNVVMAMLALLAAGLWTADTIGGNDAAIEAIYPVQAVDYLETSGLAAGRGYHSYGWGGYLIWRGLPVFIDGRADVYGDEFIFYYRQAMDGTPQWRAPLQDFDVNYVLTEPGALLPVLLEADGGWQVAYRDDVAQVMIPAEQE